MDLVVGAIINESITKDIVYHLLKQLLQSGMDLVVGAIVMCTEGVASWGQEKTKVVRHKLEDKFNVFREDEFIEELEPIDPRTVQVIASTPFLPLLIVANLRV